MWLNNVKIIKNFTLNIWQNKFWTSEEFKCKITIKNKIIQFSEKQRCAYFSNIQKEKDFYTYIKTVEENIKWNVKNYVTKI